MGKNALIWNEIQIIETKLLSAMKGNRKKNVEINETNQNETCYAGVGMKKKLQLDMLRQPFVHYFFICQKKKQISN